MKALANVELSGFRPFCAHIGSMAGATPDGELLLHHVTYVVDKLPYLAQSPAGGLAQLFGFVFGIVACHHVSGGSDSHAHTGGGDSGSFTAIHRGTS